MNRTDAGRTSAGRDGVVLATRTPDRARALAEALRKRRLRLILSPLRAPRALTEPELDALRGLDDAQTLLELAAEMNDPASAQEAEGSLAALEAEVRRDLVRLNHPPANWPLGIPAADGAPASAIDLYRLERPETPLFGSD